MLRNIAFIVICIATTPQQGKTIGENLEFYQGVRQLGMGGAGIALVNDETSLFTNPAGLGKLRDFIFTIFDLEVDGSSKSLDLALEGNSAELLEVQGLLSRLKKGKHQGEHFHFRSQVSPSLVIPNFGLGVLAKYEINGLVDEGEQSIGTNISTTLGQ